MMTMGFIRNWNGYWNICLTHCAHLRYCFHLFCTSLQFMTNELKDMEVYRSRNIFERVLALYNLASTPKDVQRLILKLCFRAIAVAGSTTLITRSGILSWIEEQSFFNGPNEPSLKHLAEKLCKTCDQVRVVDWSNRALST